MDKPVEIRSEDLMGTWEVAQYLSSGVRTWSTAMVSDYAAKGAAGIPAAFARLRSGRIWIRKDIEEWARARGYVSAAAPIEEG